MFPVFGIRAITIQHFNDLDDATACIVSKSPDIKQVVADNTRWLHRGIYWLEKCEERNLMKLEKE